MIYKPWSRREQSGPGLFYIRNFSQHNSQQLNKHSLGKLATAIRARAHLLRVEAEAVSGVGPDLRVADEQTGLEEIPDTLDLAGLDVELDLGRETNLRGALVGEAGSLGLRALDDAHGVLKQLSIRLVGDGDVSILQAEVRGDCELGLPLVVVAVKVLHPDTLSARAKQIGREVLASDALVTDGHSVSVLGDGSLPAEVADVRKASTAQRAARAGRSGLSREDVGSAEGHIPAICVDVSDASLGNVGSTRRSPIVGSGAPTELAALNSSSGGSVSAQITSDVQVISLVGAVIVLQDPVGQRVRSLPVDDSLGAESTSVRALISILPVQRLNNVDVEARRSVAATAVVDGDSASAANGDVNLGVEPVNAPENVLTIQGAPGPLVREPIRRHAWRRSAPGGEGAPGVGSVRAVGGIEAVIRAESIGVGAIGDDHVLDDGALSLGQVDLEVLSLVHDHVRHVSIVVGGALGSLHSNVPADSGISIRPVARPAGVVGLGKASGLVQGATVGELGVDLTGIANHPGVGGSIKRLAVRVTCTSVFVQEVISPFIDEGRTIREGKGRKLTVATALAAAGGVGDLELEEELHGHLLAEAAVVVREARAETRGDLQGAAGLSGRGIVALALLLNMETAARLEVGDVDVGVVALSQVDLDLLLVLPPNVCFLIVSPSHDKRCNLRGKLFFLSR